MKLTDGERWILANQYKILKHQAEILGRLRDTDVRGRLMTERDYKEAESLSNAAHGFHEAYLAVAFGVESDYCDHSQFLSATIDPETTELVDEIVKMFEALALGIQRLGLQIEPAMWQFQGFDPVDEEPMCRYLDYLVQIKKARAMWFPIFSRVPQLGRYERMLEVYRDLPNVSLSMDGITALIRVYNATT